MSKKLFSSKYIRIWKNYEDIQIEIFRYITFYLQYRFHIKDITIYLLPKIDININAIDKLEDDEVTVFIDIGFLIFNLYIVITNYLD